MAEQTSQSRQGTRGPRMGMGHGPGGRGGFEKPRNVRSTIKRLLTYLVQKKYLLLLVAACVILSSMGSVVGSYLLRPILNTLVENVPVAEKLPQVAQLLLLLLGIYLLSALCTFIQARTMVSLAQKSTNALRRDVFDKLQELPLSYFDAHTHGELMSRLSNDADNVQTALEQSVVAITSSSVLFLGIIFAMLYISPGLFLVTLLVVVAALLSFKILGGKSQTYYRKQQAAIGALNGNIQEIIEGLKVVKAFTHEETAKTDFAQLNEAYRQAATHANFYAGATMPATSNIFNIGFALTATVGGLMTLVVGLDVGGLVSYLQFSRQLMQPLAQMSQQMNMTLSALAGAERIFELMDSTPEVDAGTVTLVPIEKTAEGTWTIQETGHTQHWAWKVPKNGKMHLVPVMQGEGNTLVEVERENAQGVWAWKYPDHTGKLQLHRVYGAVQTDAEGYYLSELKGAVRLTDVDFAYVPGKPVLKEVSVFANPGQKIAFVGSTGAGKTTITNLINRFYEIEQGMLTYDGMDVREIQKASLRASLGMVLQDTHLFTGTILENIRYGRLEATDAECVAAAKTANADSFIRRLPNGYQTLVSGDGVNLSQGQRQLLAIARVAVADPPVMVLDEATSSIDTRTEQLIADGMDALMRGRTVLVIAHRLSTVRNADCIVVIEQGKVAEKGNHQQLLQQQGRYYQLYTGQFELT